MMLIKPTADPEPTFPKQRNTSFEVKLFSNMFSTVLEWYRAELISFKHVLINLEQILRVTSE